MEETPDAFFQPKEKTIFWISYSTGGLVAPLTLTLLPSATGVIFPAAPAPPLLDAGHNVLSAEFPKTVQSIANWNGGQVHFISATVGDWRAVRIGPYFYDLAIEAFPLSVAFEQTTRNPPRYSNRPAFSTKVSQSQSSSQTAPKTTLGTIPSAISVSISSASPQSDLSQHDSSVATVIPENTQGTTGTSHSTTAALKSPGPSAGMIAGSVIGGVAALVIVIGAVLFFLYRKRKLAKLKRTSQDAKSICGTINSECQELPPEGIIRELDPEKGTTIVWKANEMSEQRKAGELLSCERSPSRGRTRERSSQTRTVLRSEMSRERRATTATPPVPSVHVKAQKKREIEWLQAEEARLRERRERLTGDEEDTQSTAR